MLEQKTKYGRINKSFKGDLYHETFFKNFESIPKKEEKIVMNLIDNGYKIEDKKIFYVGGGCYKGVDTFLNYDTGDYVCEEYSYVEHGVWKLKFKIKK
tara:strand:- start:2087 stop:2380 length:294 start_codon:yes stop_codon:yes gene_type:complete